MPKIVPPMPSDEEIPFAADEIAEVDQELRRSRQFGTEILEDFAEDRDNLDDQEGRDRRRRYR